jgi:hypothetical protein
MFIDRGFEAFVRRKLGPRHSDSLLPTHLKEIQEWFDVRVKKEYNPTDPRGPSEFPIPFPEVPDLPEAGIEDESMRVRK